MHIDIESLTHIYSIIIVSHILFFISQSVDEFILQLLNKTREIFPSLQNYTNEKLSYYLTHSHAANAYDAAWSMALAWNNSMRDLFRTGTCNTVFGDDSIRIADPVKMTLNSSLSELSLQGLSVTIRNYIHNHSG